MFFGVFLNFALEKAIIYLLGYSIYIILINYMFFFK